jgi:hypothetical protein
LNAELDGLVADNLFLDAERSRRWTTAFTRFAISDDCANLEHLQKLIAKWRPFGDEIVETGSRFLGSFSAGLRSCDQIAAAAAGAWRSLLHEAGLQT